MEENPDCFLLSQTLVMGGIGKAVVCCVGKHSRRHEVEKEILNAPPEDPDTPLAEKLETIGGQLGMYGIYGALLIFAIFLAHQILVLLFSDRGLYDKETLTDFLNSLTLFVTIIAVAVPEGLPLAVSISLAYSVDKMEDEKILAKALEAPEAMGGVEEVCTGKTGTLTKNEMKVARFFCC